MPSIFPNRRIDGKVIKRVQYESSEAKKETLYRQPNAPNPMMITHSIFRDRYAFARHFV